MSSQIYGRVFIFSAALALAACASNTAKPPSGDTAQANLAVASHQAATSDATTPTNQEHALKVGNGYRKVTKNGQEYYCRKEIETGSLVKAQTTCLTQAEMTALSQNGQDLLNGVRNTPGTGPAMGPSGGTYNSAISH